VNAADKGLTGICEAVAAVSPERPASVHTHIEGRSLVRWAAWAGWIPGHFHTAQLRFMTSTPQRPQGLYWLDHSRNYYQLGSCRTQGPTRRAKRRGYRRGEGFPLPDSIACEEFIEPKPMRRQLRTWGIPDVSHRGNGGLFKPEIARDL